MHMRGFQQAVALCCVLRRPGGAAQRSPAPAAAAAAAPEDACFQKAQGPSEPGAPAHLLGPGRALDLAQRLGAPLQRLGVKVLVLPGEGEQT